MAQAATLASLEQRMASLETVIQTLIQEIKAQRAENINFKKELLDTRRQVLENTQKNEELEGGLVGAMGEIKNVTKEVGEISGHVSRLDMERMTYFLRFQNVFEQPGECLPDLMSTILADYLNKPKDEVRGNIDLVYRINSAYARINEVPREIHVKFVRRSTREEILKLQREKPLIYQQKTVTILKQVPRKIRDARRKFSFLSKTLFDHGIWFKWVIPEGMLVFWEGGRVKIKTVAEAEAFLKTHSSVLGEDPGGTEGATAPPTGGQGGEKEDTIAKRLRSKK